MLYIGCLFLCVNKREDEDKTLVTKEVEVKWNARTRNWYESKGYKFTKTSDTFKVKAEDLTHGSEVVIECKCDKCGSINKLDYKHYLRNIKRNNGKYYCKDCRMFSQKEVEDMFVEAGYKLISEYKGAAFRVTYICPKHGKKTVLMSNFLGGARCRKCFNEAMLVPYEDVKKAFEDKGYELLSQEYKGNKKYLKYRCSKHPDKIQKIKYNDIQQGHGCAFCKADEAAERQSGSGAWNWKGGISSLSSYLRGAINCWKYDSMKACNFKCVLTGGRFDAVHHLTSFSSIMQEVLDELNMDVRESVSMYSDEELEIMSNHIIAKHNEYGLGVCICDRLHKLFHKLYCKVGCTPEMFEEFTERYKRGEFDE